MKRITVRTRQRFEVVDLTREVREVVAKSRIGEGMCVVYSPHTTAGVTVNENYDPDVKHDVLEKLRRMFPKEEVFFQHGEGNSDSHLMTSFTGASATMPISGGRLALGQWQGVWFCEFDGPREREVWVQCVGEMENER